MSMHVTVELDGDQLVVVKSATNATGADRLRAEARRLDRARHPGVVALLDAGAVAERTQPDGGTTPDGTSPRASASHAGFALRLAHAGEPVTHWRASLTDVAGVAAAVASTLADLHDIDVVHGRLDASHVLLGEDGRPRLCSLADPGDASPADDVAAWGRLVSDLVSRTPDERRGLRTLVRGGGPGAARRALLAVCDRACDPAADRRPTARAVGDAVVAAVPNAGLPSHAPGTTTTASGGGDTLDRIWSFAGEPSEDERWAAAFGSAPTERPVATASPPADERPLAAELPLTWHQPDPWFDRDDATRDHRPVGMPRHVHDDTEGDAHRTGRRRGAVLAAAAGVLVVAAAGLAMAVAAIAGGTGRAGSAGCAPVGAPAADVDGDGCPEKLALDGTTVDAGVATFTLGEPGDVVTLGDWDCDGRATAALLRPSTGDVFHFATWAAEGETLTVTSVEQVPGGTALRAESDGDPGCERLVVEDADGTATVVAMRP